MKIIKLLIIPLLFMGCASLEYNSPDGTKVVYRRFLTTSDNIKGSVGSASIESKGQKNIDFGKIIDAVK